VSFASPALLAGLVVLAGALLAWALRRRPPALAWPAMDEVRAAGGRRHDPARGLGLALRASALVLLAAAAAEPLLPEPADRTRVEGIDLMLVVDTSLSMRSLDAEVAGDWRTRLDLAREVVRRFALERVAEGDRVGLVVFGDDAFTLCPLTRDGRLLAAALDRVRAGMAGEATALGDALALAVKRLGGGEGAFAVLLTDGRSNAGSVPADVAAGLAAARGVRVHTVGIGSEGEVPIALEPGRAGRGLRFERHDLDRETLEHIARATRGRAFEARHAATLAEVYAEIDALERVPREMPPPPGRRSRPEPFLALAACLVVGEIATTRVLRRRLP
jgi:Ca-activated chloride channel family protein